MTQNRRSRLLFDYLSHVTCKRLKAEEYFRHPLHHPSIQPTKLLCKIHKWIFLDWGYDSNSHYRRKNFRCSRLTMGNRWFIHSFCTSLRYNSGWRRRIPLSDFHSERSSACYKKFSFPIEMKILVLYKENSHISFSFEPDGNDCGPFFGSTKALFLQKVFLVSCL